MESKKHVFDHKRRVHVHKDGKEPLSDDNLTPNEEELLKLIERLEEKIKKLEGEKKDSRDSS